MGALAEQPKYTTVIKVIAIAAKKEGRKTVGVKGATEQGELWVNFYAEKAETLERGESYEIQYQGDLKLVTSFKHITPHGHQAREPETRQAPQQTNGKKMDQNGNGNGNGYGYRPTHQRDARRMFVTKILGDLISSGRVRDDVESIRKAIDDLCQAWEMSEISSADYGNQLPGS